MFKLTLAALAVLALTESGLAQSPNGAEARLKERNITLPPALAAGECPPSITCASLSSPGV